MKIFRLTLSLLFASFIGQTFAQVPSSYVDVHASSTQKAFKSQKVQAYSLWERIEHDCSDKIPNELARAYAKVPKHSQGDLVSMVQGNLRISNQYLYPTEGQFIKSSFFQEQGGADLMACITGVRYNKSDLMKNDFDYFEEIVRNLRYLNEEQKYDYHMSGRAYKFRLLKDVEDLNQVLEKPSELGMMVSIEGMHSLSNYFYINKGLFGTPDYEDEVLRNLDRLKGIIPLVDNTNEYVDFPILSINFENWFYDGICGKLERMGDNMKRAFADVENIDKGLTPLGQKVVKRMIDKNEGFRILVDVSQMSLAGRQWYYDQLQSMRYMGDTVAVLASNVGVCGESWSSEAYLEREGANKSRDLYFNHYKGNMSRQDLQQVNESKGLVGLSLDPEALMGGKFQEIYRQTLDGSAEQRTVTTKIVAANIFRIIHVVQSPDMWNRIALSTNFDSAEEPFHLYRTARDYPRLVEELREFFKNPTDIYDLYSAEQIKQFMYGFSADELIEKITTQNSLDFMKRHLQQSGTEETNTATKDGK